jgi:hypothetical protein
LTEPAGRAKNTRYRKQSRKAESTEMPNAGPSEHFSIKLINRRIKDILYE